MSDPELRSDESVILRTQGIFVKSIPFEGILTNKRIILVDRAKNLLPQKEIPLVTIKDIDVGENAIRDQIITLSVVARSGEMRQMILTFSRQTGGNRIRERDAWAKALKENVSSSFEQVIRKVIPGRGPAPRKQEHTVSPRIEIISPESQNAPPERKIPTKKMTEVPPPVKISETTRRPAPSSGEIKGSDMPVSGFGTYCSRCGNRVPEGSGFCNRCGSQIVVPDRRTAFTRNEKVPQSSKLEAAARTTPPPSPVESPAEPIIDLSTAEIQSAIQEFSQHPEIPQEPETFAQPQGTDISDSDSRTSQINEETRLENPVVTTSQVSEFNPPSGKPPAPRSPRGFSVRPGSKTVYAIVIVFLIIAIIVGGFFIYPLIPKGGSIAPNTSGSPTPTATTLVSSGTIIPRVTPTVPVDGVYVHIMYLGSWKGSYGISSDMKNLTNSGDRYYPVENATGTVEASFEKRDSSTKQTITVEILKNGRVLTSGNTTAGFGKVTLSVDIATGVAKPPQVSAGTAATSVATITTLKTTIPATSMTTAAQ
jgi:hypothetical protein